MEGDRPEAVLVEGDRIAAVGSAELLLSQGADRVIDLAGRCLMPGLVDTHTHFFQVAKQAIDIDLSPARSLDDVADILRKYRSETRPLPPWIGGSGWDKNVYPSLDGFDRTFLDRFFSEIPVILKSKDLHTKWCNTTALEHSGIDSDTPDPPGGMIGRLPDGSPDGFIYERAWKLLQSVMILPPREMQKRLIREAVKRCHSLGLTGFHLMESETDHRLYPELQREGMKIRVYWHFSQSQLDSLIAAGTRSYTGDGWFMTCGMKLFMDGSIGSQTAYMFDEYPGRAGQRGVLAIPIDQLRELLDKAARNDLACSVHAIGDRCVHEVIEAIAQTNREAGWRPHRIEHLQCVLPDDIPTLVEHRITAAVQPVHIKADVELIRKYWQKVESHTYPFRTLRDAGVVMGFGSDAPVETINPFEGIYAALERKYRNDPANPTWTPEQRLTIEEAIAGYTIDAARLTGEEHRLGSISVGKQADMIVIDDFTDQPNECWLTMKCRMTMVGGEIVSEDTSPGV
jgi:predicted amidohydrolase YtcJ